MGIRTWAVVAAVLGLAVVGPVWAQAPGPLEGTWKFTAAGDGGKDDPPESVAALEFVVKGADYKLLEAGNEAETGTLKLGREGDLDTIDWVIASGDDKGKTQRGIFKVTGDTVSFAYLPAGQEGRPRELSNKAGQSFAVVKRAGAASAAPSPAPSPAAK